MQAGQTDDAIVQFQKAIVLEPNFSEAYNSLGDAYRQKGITGEAVANYQKAIELQPQLISPRVSLSWLLATWPDASIRNGARAVTLAEEANQFSGGSDPKVLRILAAAYAETGRFPDAVSTAKKALALAAAQSNTSLENKLQAEIRLYQAHSPCRSTNN